MITLKPIRAAVLTLDTGEQIHVEQIGKGRYSTAWRNGTAVYVQTHEKDAAKEMLCNLSGMPHLPVIARLPSNCDQSVYNWFKMPLYGKLTAASKRAWSQFKHLKSLQDAAWITERANTRYPAQPIPAKVNQRFIENVRGTPGLESFGDPLEQLAEWCATYGSSWLIEPLQPRNCAVDAAGELILLDPVFDLAEVQAEQARRMKRARGY